MSASNRLFTACKSFDKKEAALFQHYFQTPVSGPCRELAFPSFLFFANKRLLNHRIRVLQVQDLDECELRCYHEHNCVSINFKLTMLARGKYSCELNNSTHGEHERDLVPDQDHFYRGTKCLSRRKSIQTFFFQNVCSNSPCQNNGTCQSGFTKKGYRCLCPDGWTGGTCKMGKAQTWSSSLNTKP
ncbi:uncharacterized protein [Porites lutea]|uniref:uncharacterized protein n=1 Tax=Porites lutea TaxID=51062 RepID=UPI003CC6081C